METDAMRMRALLVGLLDVDVIGICEWPRWLRVVIETAGDRPECGCGGVVHRHGVREVDCVDDSSGSLVDAACWWLSALQGWIVLTMVQP